MKKKNVLIILIGILILITGSIMLTKYDTKKIVNKNIIDNKAVSYWVYDNTIGDYVEQNAVPVGVSYHLDEEKTYCENGSQIKEYDSTLGTLKYVLSGSDKCYVYFSYAVPKLEPVDNTETVKIIPGVGELDTGLVLSNNYDYITYVDWKYIVTVNNYPYFDYYDNAMGAESSVSYMINKVDICSRYPQACVKVNRIEDVLLYRGYAGGLFSGETISFVNNTSLKLNLDTIGYNYYAFRYEKEGYQPSGWYYGNFGGAYMG